MSEVFMNRFLRSLKTLVTSCYLARFHDRSRRLSEENVTLIFETFRRIFCFIRTIITRVQHARIPRWTRFVRFDEETHISRFLESMACLFNNARGALLPCSKRIHKYAHVYALIPPGTGREIDADGFSLGKGGRDMGKLLPRAKTSSKEVDGGQASGGEIRERREGIFVEMFRAVCQRIRD